MNHLLFFYQEKNGKDKLNIESNSNDLIEIDKLNALHHDEDPWLDNADRYTKKSITF